MTKLSLKQIGGLYLLVFNIVEGFSDLISEERENEVYQEINNILKDYNEPLCNDVLFDENGAPCLVSSELIPICNELVNQNLPEYVFLEMENYVLNNADLNYYLNLEFFK